MKKHIDENLDDLIDWDEVPLQDGRERLLGIGTSDNPTIDLIGPQDELTEVGVTAVFNGTGERFNFRLVVVFDGVADRIVARSAWPRSDGDSGALDALQVGTVHGAPHRLSVTAHQRAVSRRSGQNRASASPRGGS